MDNWDLIKMKNRIKRNEELIENLEAMKKKITKAIDQINDLINKYSCDIERQIEFVWNGEGTKAFLDNINALKSKCRGYITEFDGALKAIQIRINIIEENTEIARKEFKIAADEVNAKVMAFNARKPI